MDPLPPSVLLTMPLHAVTEMYGEEGPVSYTHLTLPTNREV